MSSRQVNHPQHPPFNPTVGGRSGGNDARPKFYSPDKPGRKDNKMFTKLYPDGTMVKSDEYVIALYAPGGEQIMSVNADYYFAPEPGYGCQNDEEAADLVHSFYGGG